MSPGPDEEIAKRPYEINYEVASRSDPYHHDRLALDCSMYLGAIDDDLMIRVMDKVKDEHCLGETSVVLKIDRRRVRLNALN